MPLRRVNSKTRAAVGVGLGVGLAGAAYLAVRYAFRRPQRVRIPDVISPEQFVPRVATTRFGQIVYHTSGTGPPLVFLHGLHIGASSYEWSRVYRGFTASHRVIAPDLLGFGESERPAAFYSAEDHARCLLEFLDVVCGRLRPTIVASGLAGGIATLMASHHPERAERLLLLMPTGLSEYSSQRIPFGFSALARTPVLNGLAYRHALASHPAVRTWLERCGFSDASRVSEEDVSVHHACANQYAAHYAVLAILRGRLRIDFEERFAELLPPTGLLWADRSPTAPLEFAYRLMGRAARCETLDLVRDAGILAALEKPAEIAELLSLRLSAVWGSRVRPA